MLIILNHKMNLSIDEIREYEKAIRDLDVVVLPQTPYMGLFTEGKYTLGSQCISEYQATGGISAEALVSMKVKYVMVGHAERRIIRKENDEVIAQKIKDIVNNNMTPIMCVGETLEEKNNGKTLAVIENQIYNVFDRLEGYKDNIMIGYEPVWSIGTDQMPNNEEITKMLEYIKNICWKRYHLSPALLYGGSINEKNINEIKEIINLDGIIIGSASLDVKEVKKIYNIVNE